MIKIVGIRFKSCGKIYDFASNDFDLKCGDHVIVETENGLGFGTVVNLPTPFDESQSDRIFKNIKRIADEVDLYQKQEIEKFEKEAYDFCLKSIEELKLSMNLFEVESSFDMSKLIFFFTAPGRVDFRELVKVLVRNFRIRIEMRQVGVRNQAKMWGGIGRCGRATCCSTFMTHFDPVSIRMAKEQNLSLNPTKISGLCGRLMCCLNYENETYKALRKTFPPCGKMVQTPKGEGMVIRQNIIRSCVTIRYDRNVEKELPLADIVWEHTDNTDEISETDGEISETDNDVVEDCENIIE